MDMEPLFNNASNAFEQHVLEALLTPSATPNLRSSHLHSQLLSAELASFHGDPLYPPACANPYASFHRISLSSSSISQSLHSLPPLSQSLWPADQNGAAGLPNPNFKSATDYMTLSQALPPGFYGERRSALPASFHGDNGDGAGRDYQGCKASKLARFHGDHEGSAGLVNPNLIWETEGRHSQMQAPASFHGDVEDAARMDRHRPVPASKMIKTASSVRDAEILRRKKISQLFSKLEVLLPPEDVIKISLSNRVYDKTSLTDAISRALKQS